MIHRFSFLIRCKVGSSNSEISTLTIEVISEAHGGRRQDAMLTSNIFTILTTLLFLYALITGVFLLMENRRPQSTLAWMLVLFFAPGIGLLVYLLFGRDTKAFSKRSKLLMQDLEANARPLLSPILSRVRMPSWHDWEAKALAAKGWRCWCDGTLFPR